MEARSVYLASAAVAAEVLGASSVADSWESPSVLAEWRVSGLAGHLARAVTTVEQYLDGGEAAEGEPLTPGGYYAQAVDTADLSSDLHRNIRRRGDDMAAEGHAALCERVSSSLQRLRERLPQEPAERILAVFAGVVMQLDDYLATRLVEIVVHCDDLAVSVGVATPEFPPEAYGVVTDVLVDTARHRHGSLAVVRALARRERDGVQALRVF